MKGGVLDWSLLKSCCCAWETSLLDSKGFGCSRTPNFASTNCVGIGLVLKFTVPFKGKGDCCKVFISLAASEHIVNVVELGIFIVSTLKLVADAEFWRKFAIRLWSVAEEFLPPSIAHFESKLEDVSSLVPSEVLLLVSGPTVVDCCNSLRQSSLDCFRIFCCCSYVEVSSLCVGVPSLNFAPNLCVDCVTSLFLMERRRVDSDS